MAVLKPTTLQGLHIIVDGGTWTLLLNKLLPNHAAAMKCHVWSNFCGYYILQVATWKVFLQFYFQGSFVSSYGLYCNKGRLKNENLLDSQVTTKFTSL